MIFHRRQLHQTILTIFGIKVESEPYKDLGAHRTEGDAEPLCHATHIHDDEHDEIRNQTSGEDEQILRLQTLVFYRSTNTLIDRILSHLEEE